MRIPTPPATSSSLWRSVSHLLSLAVYQRCVYRYEVDIPAPWDPNFDRFSKLYVPPMPTLASLLVSYAVVSLINKCLIENKGTFLAIEMLRAGPVDMRIDHEHTFCSFEYVSYTFNRMLVMFCGRNKDRPQTLRRHLDILQPLVRC
ncbi:jg19562 [Pararge aegeria aegeria]|uniref:Jg19562 protein n=1 Tax=Pararge aegeria aegeria TaxID=348720 RepID=A0A8S4RDF5_9NEOP|nr:jg19562 [Pararge aegeria aegeria]